MIEAIGSIWDYYDQGHWVAVTTNSCLNSSGEAVMGRGVALDAARRFPKLPRLLGDAIKKQVLVGNNSNPPVIFPQFRILTFPTKYDWRSPSSLNLIGRSAVRISMLVDKMGIPLVAMPRPGCGLGKLRWEDVKPQIEPLLDDRFVVVHQEFKP